MTNQAIVWSHPRKGNYLQTPIVVGDFLWGCSNDGIVTCFNVQTGRVYYEERIGGGGQGFTASPVAANGISISPESWAMSSCCLRPTGSGWCRPTNSTGSAWPLLPWPGT
jgi:hypothetical protein